MSEEPPITPEQKKLSSISNTVMLILVIVACGAGTQCSAIPSIRSDVSAIRYRTMSLKSDLDQIKDRLDIIERGLKERPHA